MQDKLGVGCQRRLDLGCSDALLYILYEAVVKLCTRLVHNWQGLRFLPGAHVPRQKLFVTESFSEGLRLAAVMSLIASFLTPSMISLTMLMQLSQPKVFFNGKQTDRSMKAIRVQEFGGPEVLRLEEVPTPQPSTSQVLVGMHAVGINPVETYIRAGTYARLPEVPYTPGNDGAGVVEKVGPEVTEFKTGDRVYVAGSLTGTYAEFALCKTDQVHPLPANVSFAQGPAMGTPYATAYRGLFQRAEARPGETVLVHGASGGVGTAAVQLARAGGLRVFGTVGSDEGQKLAREEGAHEVFDHRVPDHFEQIMKATGGRGVDVVVELLANVNLGKDLTILAKGGRVAIIGSRGPVEIDPRDTMQRDADLRGMMLPNTPPTEMASIHAALVAGLENGTLRPVIGKEFLLAEAAQAHRAVMERGAVGKIVLRTSKK
jgi:NADPH2:quinone reductase